MKRNPEIVEAMFDNGWDNRRGNPRARKIVRECIPLLKGMQEKYAKEHGDVAATTDIDQTVKRFHTERQSAVGMRKRLKSSERHAKRLKKDLDKMLAIRAQTERMIEETRRNLETQRTQVLQYDTKSAQMEQKLRELRKTMTQVVVTLLTDVAGISAAGDSNDNEVVPPRSCQYGEMNSESEMVAADNADDGSGGNDSGDHEGEDVRFALNSQGIEADSEMCRVSARRVRDYNMRAALHRRLVDKKAQGMTLSQVEKGVVRRGAPVMKQDDLRVWSELHNAVKHAHGSRVPRAMLEPDGEQDAEPGTCWWDRFSAFYLDALGNWNGCQWQDQHPFETRDHDRAAKFLSELNDHLMEAAYYPDGEEGNPECPTHSSIEEDGDRTDGVSVQEEPRITGDDVEGGRGDVDALLLTEKVEVAEHRIIEKIRGMLADGAFEDERVSKLARAAVEEGRIPTTLYGALQRSTIPEGDYQECGEDQSTPPPCSGEGETSVMSSPQANLVMNKWDIKLRKELGNGTLSEQDASVLWGVWRQRFEKSLWGTSALVDRGGMNKSEFVEYFAWVTNQITMLVKTIVSQGNRAFISAAGARIGNDPPGGLGDMNQRMKRHHTFMTLFMEMFKMRPQGPDDRSEAGGEPDGPKVSEPSSGRFLPMSNYIHTDHWLRDWRMCTLVEALKPGSRERFNLIDPPDYTIGGWACLRCTTILDPKGGDCRCRCFRGHTRTQCMAPGSGCYGFHPNRVMEYLTLGIPRMPLDYTEQRQGAAGSQETPASGPAGRGGRRPRSKNKKDLANPNAFRNRRWVFSQKWYTFRKEIKAIVCGYEAWFGVVPPEERPASYDGLVKDVGALAGDWLNRFDWLHYGPPMYGKGTEKKRCEWVAKTHLDILLDESKHEPERKRTYPTHNRGPNWRWISGGCPICTFLYEANSCNVGRGLCNGCRTWRAIVTPAYKLMNTDPKYSILRSVSSAPTKRVHKKGGVRSRNKKHGASLPPRAVPSMNPYNVWKLQRYRNQVVSIPAPRIRSGGGTNVEKSVSESLGKRKRPSVPARTSDTREKSKRMRRPPVTIFDVWGMAESEDRVRPERGGNRETMTPQPEKTQVSTRTTPTLFDMWNLKQ